MPVFAYQALDHSGRRQSGLINGDSRADARDKLRQKQLYVVDIVERDETQVESSSIQQLLQRLRPVSTHDLAMATRQLASLLRAGMPLVPALGVLVEQQQSGLSGVWEAVRDRVNQGSTLADALAEREQVFSQVFLSMVRAGEATGNLDQVLSQLADMSERRVALTSKVRAAMAYPAFMLLVGFGVVTFLLAHVVPSIAKLFTEMSRELPWPTVLLLNVSALVRSYGLLILIAGAGSFLWWRRWTSTETGRHTWDRWMLAVPVFGDLARKVSVARFATTFGMLLKSGVPVLVALQIVRDVADNAVFEGAIDSAIEGVTGGDSIAETLKRTGVFPPVVYHMMAVGESTGDVAGALQELAKSYEREVESAVTAMTSLMEPLLIAILGGVVGFIVLAILLPIFDINQAIQ